MNNSYININGTTIVSDEKGMQKRETNNNIKKELTLENEIEIIETNITALNSKKKKLSSVEENKKGLKRCYLIALAMIIGALVIVKFCFPMINPDVELPKKILPFIKTNNDMTFFMMIPTTLLFTTPFSVFVPILFKQEIKRVQTIEEQLVFLNDELTKKKEELEDLRKTSKKESVTDTDIHSIDNSNYRAALKERLALLSCIREYHKKLEHHLEEGTLDQGLKDLAIKPENIEFAKEALKRILEK